ISALPDRGYVGVNLTVPHKELVLPMLDEVDDLAASIGAVNTIVVKDGKLLGKNTDAYGFWKNVESEAPALRKEQAFVIGANGAGQCGVSENKGDEPYKGKSPFLHNAFQQGGGGGME
ncbi:MAG: shikimate dehydrogenase family protein, partial [Rickettsiales bacterium]